MKEWLKERVQYPHVLLYNGIRDTEPEDCKNYFRMNGVKFYKLLKLVTPVFILKIYKHEVVFAGKLILKVLILTDVFMSK